MDFHHPSKLDPLAYRCVNIPKLDRDFLEEFINDPPIRRYTLYVSADRFDVPALRQAIIDAEWKTIHKHAVLALAHWDDLLYLWRNVSESSPLRRLLIRAYVKFYDGANNWKCRLKRRLRQVLPPELLFTVMTMRAGKWIPLVDSCQYHEYSQDARSCKNRKGVARYSRKRKRIPWNDADDLEFFDEDTRSYEERVEHSTGSEP